MIGARTSASRAFTLSGNISNPNMLVTGINSASASISAPSVAAFTAAPTGPDYANSTVPTSDPLYGDGADMLNGSNPPCLERLQTDCYECMSEDPCDS